MIEVENLPLEDVAMIVLLRDNILPSQSMSHTSFPKAGHMHNSLYLHAPQIDKMNNIGFFASLPSSARIHILHVTAHRLGICGTMVCCCNSVGPVPQIADNFGIQGKYLWCVHPRNIECIKYPHDSLYPS